jgi:ABC-type antimicrobial peptide transport system permease subunit
MAGRFFPNRSPIGSHFGTSLKSPEEFEVIGVVKDIKNGSLTEQLRPTAYYFQEQLPQPLDNFVVRFSGAPESVVPLVRQAIRQVNSNLAIDEVVSLSDYIGRTLAQQKLVARLASFFGLLALLLACVGLYGVLSYAVARRTNEIGIRLALGAQRGNVLWLVLREALTLVGVGIFIGVAASLFATRLAEKMLFALKPNDPLTLAAATFLLLTVATLAGFLPARRAARVDPMAALRDE